MADTETLCMLAPDLTAELHPVYPSKAPVMEISLHALLKAWRIQHIAYLKSIHIRCILLASLQQHPHISMRQVSDNHTHWPHTFHGTGFTRLHSLGIHLDAEHSKKNKQMASQSAQLHL